MRSSRAVRGRRISAARRPVARQVSPGPRMTRRRFLRDTAVGAATVGVAVAGFGGVAKAQAPPSTEVIYLADSGPFGDGITKLFTVDIDSVPGKAILTLLPDFGYGNGVVPLDQADSLACTPDGKRLYLIDKKGGFQGESHAKIGYVDLTNNSWNYLGYVTHNNVEILEIGQAAFSPIDGKLYVSSDHHESLYSLDPENSSNPTPTAATNLGLIRNISNSVVVNVSGADLVFHADGTLYLWANNANPRGLYTLQIPTTPGTVWATHLGPQPGQPGYDYSYFTGLAIRENGVGDLVGSVSGSPYSRPPYQSHIIEIDKTNGIVTNQYRMWLNNQEHTYWYGDMTAGPLVECTRTIGYWKNHSWGGETVTICDVEIDETFGKEILSNARGNNFSMLFAQLIAAKLNTYNAPYVPLIEEVETWLCDLSPPLVYEDPPGQWNIDYNRKFPNKITKGQAVEHSEDLDEFNNDYPCDEEENNCQI